MPGVPGCFAMVGVFEKGIGNLRFVARGQGGHASAPKKNTPIPRLAKFVASVDKKSPFTSRMSREVREMFVRLAPYASFPMRFVFGNLWLFEPLLVKVMPAISAQAAAMLRTTIAFTMSYGSNGINVIPQEASVSANLRFIPHQGAKESVRVISEKAKKFGVETEVMDTCEPSSSVPIDGKAFKLTQEAIAATFPGAGCSPYVVTGATDARFYAPVCDACIRFSPVVYGPKQMAGMHGVDETIAVNVLPGAVDYYKYIVKHANQL
jgi:carboxypeptidase PM20D1